MIRKPLISETNECLNLLYMSGSNMFSYFFILHPPEINHCLKILYSKPDVLFSSSNVLVKVINDKVCGLLLSAPGKNMHSLEENIGKYGKELFQSLGLFNILKVLFRTQLLKYMTHLYGDDEYYISNLAVFENYRGQGIGVELLLKAEEIARNSGCRVLSLLVDLNNHHAQRVYEKFGFKNFKTIKLPNKFQEYGIYGFNKMMKVVELGG